MKAIRYQGALDVVRFNFPTYLITCLILMVGSFAIFFQSAGNPIKTILSCVLGISGFWLVSSIIASHWVYDRSPLSYWTWLFHLFPRSPGKWLSIHAGFDETASLQKVFKKNEGISVDIFDPEIMTESSILRARKIKNKSLPAIRANLGHLPFSDGSVNVVFLIFCLHEVRSAAARLHLFTEIKRILKPDGSILIVEHGRNLSNFFAFGPGCLHFFPFRLWFKLSAEVGLKLQYQISFTPLVKALFFKVDQEARYAS